MCGIAGVFSKEKLKRDLIEKMVLRIKHRGPDNQSVIGLDNECIWLGHARLSIIDLCAGSNQPMSYQQGRYFLTYNGEVYNYIELRNELNKAGYFFKTDSDSEVIIASYAHWGKRCVEHFNGMFAFIIVDNYERKFFAARDRFGVKPLYYWKSSEKRLLAFASEIKEFVDLPGWNPKINGQITYDYLRFGLTDHTKETFFEGVFQL